jgi:hypothetical protein
MRIGVKMRNRPCTLRILTMETQIIAEQRLLALDASAFGQDAQWLRYEHLDPRFAHLDLGLRILTLACAS